MGFNGYLLKFGNVKFPLKYLMVSSYSAAPDQRTELQTFRTEDNQLHRIISPSYKTQIDFQTIPNMTNYEKTEMFKVFRNGLVSDIERKYKVEYWNDETDTYKTGYFYMPDISFTIKQIDGSSLIYDSVSISLIEY